MKKKLFIIATVLILVLSAVTVTACNTDEKLSTLLWKNCKRAIEAGTLQTKHTTAIGETLLAETSANYTFAENGSATVQTTVRKLNENPVEGETYLKAHKLPTLRRMKPKKFSLTYLKFPRTIF